MEKGLKASVINEVLYMEPSTMFENKNQRTLIFIWILLSTQGAMRHCDVTLSFCSASFCLMPADNRMRAVSVRRFPDRSRDSRVLFSLRATPRASAPFSPNPFQPRFTVCKRTLSWNDWKQIGSRRKQRPQTFIILQDSSMVYARGPLYSHGLTPLFKHGQVIQSQAQTSNSIN